MGFVDDGEVEQSSIDKVGMINAKGSQLSFDIREGEERKRLVGLLDSPGFTIERALANEAALIWSADVLGRWNTRLSSR